MFPDSRLDRLKHSLEDIGKLWREGVDDALGLEPIEVVGVGEDGAPGGLEPGGEPFALLEERGVVVEQKTDERFFGSGERGRKGSC